ncbi:MAG: hypothetical protein ACPL7R_03230 [Anaerolineae bacterium]
MATNPFIWWDFLRVVAASLLIMELLVFLMSLIAGDPVLIPPSILALVAGILAALFALTTTLVYGNRYRARFLLDAKGAQMEDAGQGRRYKWLMVALGLVARQPGAVFGATAGPSGYGERVSWRDVRRVAVHRRLRVVTLSNSWRSLLRLYCPPERFDQVVAHVQSHVAIAEERRARREARTRRKTGHKSPKGDTSGRTGG